MSDPNIETLPEVQAVASEVSYLEAYASNYVVRTAEEYAAGGEDLKRVKAAQKKLEETRTAITGPMNAALKRVNDFFRAPADRLNTIERAIKSKMVVYSDEQERIRREEQRKAEEAARREREKIEAQAREAERKAREKADAERRAAEEAAAAGLSQEEAQRAGFGAVSQLLREQLNAQLQSNGRVDATLQAQLAEAKAAEKVEQLAERAATVVAPVIQREAPKVAGVATREVWKFEITDPSKINPAFLMPDEQKIRKQVQALKGDAAALIGPGVKVWVERSIAAGAA